MNWENIKAKYPKAFYSHHKWSYDENCAYPEGKYPPIVLKELLRYNLRNLYDFFDGEGIRINVESMMGDKAMFRTHVYSLFAPTEDSTWCYARTEAEEQAFIKAFEILENKEN
jgi:hypothetical protein